MGAVEGMTGRRFAVIGSPVEHSLSPTMHRAAYAALGIEDARYERCEVGAGELAQFLREGPGRELDGASVTMPGKPEAFALAAQRDATSQQLGVANTLLRTDGGHWRAENHDVHGIVAALRDHGAEAPEHGAVLGSGATALSAVAALDRLGVRLLMLCARSPQKLRPLQEFAADRGIAVDLVPWEHHHRLLSTDVLVSALAIDGARTVAEQWRDRLEREELPVPGVLLDVLYDPWPAPIAEVVTAAGGGVADGLEMLAHQAGMQVRSMLGVPEAPVAAMLAAARAELAQRPGSAGS